MPFSDARLRSQCSSWQPLTQVQRYREIGTGKSARRPRIRNHEGHSEWLVQARLSVAIPANVLQATCYLESPVCSVPLSMAVIARTYRQPRLPEGNEIMAVFDRLHAEGNTVAEIGTDVVFPRLARSDVREPGAHPVNPNFCS